MSEAPDATPPARRPVIVPQSPATPAVHASPHAAPRVLTSTRLPPPVPGSIMRSLLSTRPWAILCAIGMLLLGVVQTMRAQSSWKALASYESLPEEEFGTLERLLSRADVFVQFAIAIACLYAMPRLFRYAGAISRLRDGRRMGELENALRHQRAVWTVFGAAGVLWLISFAGQVYFLFVTVEQYREFSEEADTYQLETGE